MQIHYALTRRRSGKATGSRKVALLHLTPGLDGVSRAANECERGLLPAEPTICVGQPTALDPSRAPQGKAILWLQLPEAPRLRQGRRQGRDRRPCRWPLDGGRARGVRRSRRARWSRAISRFPQPVKLARRAYSPADLEAMNVNLVGGDPYGGYCGLDQFFRLASLRRLHQSQDGGSRRLSYRRLDPSRPGPRRRLRLPARVVALR